MKQNEFKTLKRLFAKYRKTIISVVISSFIPIPSIFILIKKHITTSVHNKFIKLHETLIDDSNIGSFIELHNKLVSEAMPSIIMSSIIISLLIFIVIFIIGLITHFRYRHNIYLIYELKLYLKEKKESKK